MQTTVDASKSVEVDLTSQLKKKSSKLDKIKEELNVVKSNLKSVKAENADLLKKLEYNQILGNCSIPI
ncbi:hypothetical protein QE152_g39190 [Popillia japonica]|uniref:Uncharacterized protein n=1 Tax=Popillia japonica TaxID=7064 RepID=A0AAW1HUH8_POPJA